MKTRRILPAVLGALVPALLLAALAACERSQSAKRKPPKQPAKPALDKVEQVFPSPLELDIDKPIIILEEEVEITKDVPKGSSIESLSNKNLDVVDAYGLGAGASYRRLRKSAIDKQKTWQPSTLRIHKTRLKVGAKNTDVLPMQMFSMYVRVDGFRARVFLDYDFLNDRKRRLEGQFQLRLPTGAKPFFMAFGPHHKDFSADKAAAALEAVHDARSLGEEQALLSARSGILSKPKVAVFAPRVQAARAYHRTVRRKVDPALLEWSGAGIFRARIYPLMPKKKFRVSLGYDVSLAELEQLFELTLPTPQQCPRAAVRFDVAKEAGQTLSLSANGQALKAKDQGPRWCWSHSHSDSQRYQLRIQKPRSSLLVAKSALLGDLWASRITVPKLPASPLRQSPKAVFLLDRSLSMNPDGFSVQLKLMEQILAQNRDQLKDFAVLAFDIKTEWWRPRFIENTPAEWQRFKLWAGGQVLEGATNLDAALREAARPRWLERSLGESCDLFLLSDGAATWGERQASEMAASLKALGCGRLFGYHTGFSGVDGEALQRLTSATGGSLFSVRQLADCERAAKAHRQQPWALESVELPGQTELIVASRPRQIYAGQQLLIVGRGQPSSKTLSLNLGLGHEQRQLKLSFDDVVESDCAKRLYGEVVVGEMEARGLANDQTCQAYACHFRVPGRTASLLMLETTRDYKANKIKLQGYGQAVKARSLEDLMASDKPAPSLSATFRVEAFKAWLKELEQQQTVQFKMREGLDKLLTLLKDHDFVAADASKTAGESESLRASQVSAEYMQALRKHSFDEPSLRHEAERRAKMGQRGQALRAYSSLLDEHPGSDECLRIVAYRAMAWGYHEDAARLFRYLVWKRPHQAPATMGLAHCLAHSGRWREAMIWYELGISLDWPSDFGSARIILGRAYRRFLERLLDSKSTRAIPEELLLWLMRRHKSLETVAIAPGSLVVFMTWSDDSVDADLHIDEAGEDCSYRRRRSRNGGLMTRDVTAGFGPEMYISPKTRTGRYQVKVQCYGRAREKAGLRSSVIVTLVENWGQADERVSHRMVTLESVGQRHVVFDQEY